MIDFNFYLHDHPNLVAAIPALVTGDPELERLSVRAIVQGAHCADCMLFNLMFEVTDDGDVVRRHPPSNE